jgi:glutamate/tyrosine decarboxylase-like PLP-dependent enzyme
MKELLNTTLSHALSYLQSLATRPVAPDLKAVKGLSAFDVPLPKDGADAIAIINELDSLGRGATMAMPGPRFFGFVIGGSLPAALAANWLVSAWDQNTGLYNTTPATLSLKKLHSSG